MRTKLLCLAASGGVFAAALWIADGLQAKDGPPSAGSPPAASGPREADQEAIRQSARDFIAAFERGDAKAIAAQWTEQGEYESDDGTILRGRPAIEAAFAAHFKGRTGGKMEINVENIRFPSRDSAIEEGLTRTIAANALPDSTSYRAVHVREDGQWRIALAREWAVPGNRLADLDWLIGTWRGPAKEQEMVISFTRDKDYPFIVGEFSAVTAGKATSMGTMRIGVDPSSGQFTSWHFDRDGGNGHGTWLRERNHWVIDSAGIRGDGAATAAVNVLSRFGENELGWRSIDRMEGGKPQPDAPPVRLKRVIDPVIICDVPNQHHTERTKP